MQQRPVEVVHDPAQQRVPGRIEIWSEDPQTAIDDDGHGDEDERREEDASCETCHWRASSSQAGWGVATARATQLSNGTNVIAAHP